MRELQRNRKIIYYADYTGKSQVVDAQGHKTGQWTTTHGVIYPIRVSVSPARGSSDLEMFGINTIYTKTLILDKNCPIKEDSFLWIDTDPISGQTENKPDYVVVQIAKSLNSTTIAIKEIK